MNKILAILISFTFSHHLFCANWYVDNNATGSNAGTSWTNAWESFTDISGINSGDIVSISGGSTTKTYFESLICVNGVRYQVGQDAGHNGQVIIDAQNTRNNCITLAPNVTLSGYGSTVTTLGAKGIYHAIGIAVTGAIGGAIVATYENANNTILEYLKIYETGSKNEDESNGVDTGHGMHLNGATGVTIRYCIFNQVYQDGINAAGRNPSGWGNNTLHHCLITQICDDGLGTGQGWDIYENEVGEIHSIVSRNTHCVGAAGHPDGMQLQGSYYRVWNNVFYNASTFHIWWGTLQSGTARGFRFLNNIIYMTEHEGFGHVAHALAVARDASGVATIADIIVANNTIVEVEGARDGTNSGWGIRFFDDIGNGNANVDDAKFLNNIIINIPAHAISDEWAEPNDVVWDYNIIVAGNYGTTNVDYGGGEPSISYSTWQGLGYNINGSTTMPSFINYTQNNINGYEDFQLSSDDLVALDSGVAVVGDNMPPGWPFDFNGVSRPQGNGWDIGAYEGSSINIIPGIPQNLQIKK